MPLIATEAYYEQQQDILRIDFKQGYSRKCHYDVIVDLLNSYKKLVNYTGVKKCFDSGFFQSEGIAGCIEIKNASKLSVSVWRDVMGYLIKRRLIHADGSLNDLQKYIKEDTLGAIEPMSVTKNVEQQSLILN